MKNKKWLIPVIILVIISIIGIIISLQVNLDTKTNKNINQKDTVKIYKHIFAEQISKNDYFKGEFIANDVVSIYPRRDAIVRDILVDIGDEVKTGETIAILFNPGVEGEANSKINIKSTLVQTKQSLLVDIKNVKNAKISELDKKIEEKEIILSETIKNFDSKISQIGDTSTVGGEYQVQLKGLENLQTNLENAKLSKEELLSESNKNIKQKEELLNSKLNEIYSKIIPIFYIGNNTYIDFFRINTYDFSDSFGAKNTAIKNELTQKVTLFNSNYDPKELSTKYEDLMDINNTLILVLQNTITSIDITDNDISTNISNINTFNTSLISQKEIVDDAKNMYSILEIAQKEKLENIETNIYKKENELVLLGTKSNSTQSEKSLSVEKLKAQIETLKKSRELLIAVENKGITSIKNDIKVAQANLNKEYLASGDYKIISPFTGIISKRGINIGEKISQNIEAFRVTNVDTTLSRITKKEIKFYVPENIKENLEINKEIVFYTGDNMENSFTGTIYRISPEIDENNFTITVQAKVNENINLPNKSTLRVSLETELMTFKIPSSTVYNKDERKIIYYKKENGKLGIRDINIVSDDGEYTLITGNISKELKIVTTPIFIK